MGKKANVGKELPVFSMPYCGGVILMMEPRSNRERRIGSKTCFWSTTVMVKCVCVGRGTWMCVPNAVRTHPVDVDMFCWISKTFCDLLVSRRKVWVITKVRDISLEQQNSCFLSHTTSARLKRFKLETVNSTPPTPAPPNVSNWNYFWHCCCKDNQFSFSFAQPSSYQEQRPMQLFYSFYTGDTTAGRTGAKLPVWLHQSASILTRAPIQTPAAELFYSRYINITHIDHRVTNMYQPRKIIVYCN